MSPESLIHEGGGRLCRGFDVAFRVSVHSLLFLFCLFVTVLTAHVRLLGCADGRATTQSNRKREAGGSQRAGKDG